MDVTSRSSMSAAGPILQELLGPIAASPMKPCKSVDQYTQHLPARNFIVAPPVSAAYPKKTPLCAVVTRTARSVGFVLSLTEAIVYLSDLRVNSLQGFIFTQTLRTQMAAMPPQALPLQKPDVITAEGDVNYAARSDENEPEDAPHHAG